MADIWKYELESRSETKAQISRYKLQELKMLLKNTFSPAHMWAVAWFVLCWLWLVGCWGPMGFIFLFLPVLAVTPHNNTTPLAEHSLSVEGRLCPGQQMCLRWLFCFRTPGWCGWVGTVTQNISRLLESHLKTFTSVFQPPPLLFLIDDQVTTGEENDMQQWFKLYLSQEIIHHTAWIQSI